MKENRKTREAMVIRNAMNKTVIVEIKQLLLHPQFKKYHTVKKKYKVHDEKNECKIGDKVEIQESRPLSREKRWVVLKILSKVAA